MRRPPGCSGGPGTGGYILAYDAGSTLLLLNQKGEICFQPHTLAGCGVRCGPDGGRLLCYVTGSAVKSELQLLDREQRSVFAVMPPPGISPAVPAPGGGVVCAVALEEQEGTVSSVAVVYRTDRRIRWQRWIWAVRW